jgi:hypothetical protein
MNAEGYQAVQKLKAFCTEASATLGYTGINPVEFWTGCILRFLSLHRPESKYIKWQQPLTIFSKDYPDLCVELASYIKDNGDGEFRYAPQEVN